MHRSIVKHDAIGNDIKEMYYLLNKEHHCYVFCEFLFNEELQSIDESELKEIVSHPDNLIIYHHSVYWEDGQKLIKGVKAKIIFRYHNITPEKFFEPYNENYYMTCKQGREQTKYFQQTYKESLWMSDSKFNSEDLTLTDKIVVVPPFNNVPLWDEIQPNEELLKSIIYSDCINLLFVSRVAPNKGHIEMIEVIRNYVENYGNKIKLYILGKFDDTLKGYNDEIKYLIKRYRLENNIVFIGEVNESILISYYLGCDFYLNMSNHEGFCVPLLEAQYLRLPIIAKATSAVPETIGDSQLVLKDKIEEYAAAIHVLIHNAEYKDYIIEKGYKNYIERFSKPIIQEAFEKSIKAYMEDAI